MEQTMNIVGETPLRRADGALREEAERHLQALAGQQARLREDQWSAISALAADRRRVLVVQRTG
jgi:ATP-dependent DNA helicase RecQ